MKREILRKYGKKVMRCRKKLPKRIPQTLHFPHIFGQKPGPPYCSHNFLKNFHSTFCNYLCIILYDFINTYNLLIFKS